MFVLSIMSWKLLVNWRGVPLGPTPTYRVPHMAVFFVGILGLLILDLCGLCPI
jgi:hypothetical protein